LDNWNPLVLQLIAQRPFKRGLNLGILHFLYNVSTRFVKKRLNQAVTMERLVAYSLHPNYDGAKIVVTDSSQFLPSKNPFLPIGSEEIPFFPEETHTC